jgi:SAM-dependent methyltransferase
MPTQGELEYFRSMGTDELRHAAGKPWSDADCGLYLMELGAMMGCLPESGRLLDIGCGTGWTSVLFAQRGFDVVGQDVAAEAISAGRKLKEERGLTNLEFVQADYESPAFENEFDVAVFFDSLHHSLDERKALGSAYRALKPGGICVTSEPGVGHARRSTAAVKRFGVTERDMGPGRIVRAARASGFRCVGIHPHASHLYVSLFRSRQHGLTAKVFRIPGMRTAAAVVSLVLLKYASGIVVLQK